ncbi:MAG: prephenate dehydrogenase/arogenate dehydrogenase family protein, partial [Methylococcales bacterium]|nr:prephenate dehydrogenase/arogenate dehydrogenase family protein [Methylococcales bacterium]
TPLPETNPAFKTRVEEMWHLTGARVVDMDAELHDQILGVTSHLPHVIVYTLINYLAQQNEQEMHYQFAAGGLYDLTRIASSDAVMWSDIFLNNKDKIINIVRDYAAELNTLADQIEADDKTQLVQRFEQAKQVRATLADFRKRN